MVGPPGFEPGTSCTPSKRSSVGSLENHVLFLEEISSYKIDYRAVVHNVVFAPVLDPTRLTMPQGEDFHEPFVVLARYLTAIRNDRLAGDKFRVVR